MAKRASSSKRKRVTSSKPSPAAEVIAGNIDLLTDILLRLPAKSLIRFKCVSKHWCSLASDPQFGLNHLRRNPRPSISGLYARPFGKIESVPLSSTLPTLSFLDEGRFWIDILHSCNGLLLLAKFGYPDKPRCIVCNPTTQKYLELPQQGGHYVSGCLAFDPSKSHHYKVILGSKIGIEIYSSESGCWKRVPTQNGGYGNVVFDESGVFFGNGVFWRGAIHWLRRYERDLLRFEVEEEKIIATPSPSRPNIFKPCNIRYFGECGGRLLLIQGSRPGFKILEMDKDYSHWTVNCRVDLKPLVHAFPKVGVASQCPVLCVFEGEEEKDFALVLAIPGKFISYNPKRKTWNVLRQWAPGEITGHTAKFDFRYPFVASLSPV